MAFHLLAYITAAFNQATLAALDVLTGDPLFYADTSSKTYVPPRDVQLMAAFAGGTNLQQARIEAQTLLRVGYMSIVPIESAASASGDIGVATYADRPVKLVNGEGIYVKAANTSSGPVAAVLICGFDPVKVLPGEGFWIRYTATTAATAGAFKTLVVTYDSTLPAGTYAIIGMDHWSATAVAARLILEGVKYRPGVVAHNAAAASRTHEMSYQAGLGVWGYFTNRSMPQIEALCTAADTAHTGYIYVVRVGDVDVFQSLSSGK